MTTRSQAVPYVTNTTLLECTWHTCMRDPYTWPITSRDPERSNPDPDTLEPNVSKTAGDDNKQQSLITR